MEEAFPDELSAPVAALVDRFYAETEAIHGRRWDTSSLIARLNRGDQATLPKLP